MKIPTYHFIKQPLEKFLTIKTEKRNYSQTVTPNILFCEWVELTNHQQLISNLILAKACEKSAKTKSKEQTNVTRFILLSKNFKLEMEKYLLSPLYKSHTLICTIFKYCL